MSNPNINSYFFFYEDCCNIKIEPNSVEHAYLALLSGDLVSSLNIFSINNSPRGRWGTVLVSILQGEMTSFPTYFQIRNFYEIDLDLLIKNEKLEYIEQLLGALDILSTVNQEIYKYTARVMFVNKLYTAALKYMEKAKKIHYNDAELHFMLSNYYMKMNNAEEALFYIKECQKLIPDYFPAKLMQRKIEENSF